MNKFLVAFLCGILAVNSSFAGNKEQCPDPCVSWDKDDPTVVTVCFEHAQPNFNNDIAKNAKCEDKFKELIRELISEDGKDGYKVNLQQTGTAMVVGEADATGNAAKNMELSKKRANFIKELLDTIVTEKQFSFKVLAGGDAMTVRGKTSDASHRIVSIMFPMIGPGNTQIEIQYKYYDVLDQAKADAIDDAEGELDKLFADEKDNVWRDGQGKFNYHRLISDGVAGVVLGTTGALVTSKLVKEKQVKDGFEDINCTIGDWVVAGWGDEFWVDIQK